jgi:CxxH/CxxC protein (TIGR04129 family)
LFVVCKEHIERAIDHFVDEYEDAPDVIRLADTSFSSWTAPECCHFCGDKPEYLIV